MSLANSILGRFISSTTETMNYPVKKTEEEWKAVLNPGTNDILLYSPYYSGGLTNQAFFLTFRAISHPPWKRHRSPLLR